MAEAKRRSFDAAFKLKVVGYAELHSNRAAARHFGVDEKRVREWKKQKNALEALPQKKRRLDGGGRKAALPGVEEELVIWIDEMRAENQQVRRSGIQQKALSIIAERGETSDFTASRGWLENFCKRHHLSLRRRTTVSQRLPSDLIPKVISFIMKTRKLLVLNGYSLSAIGNMDETPLWLDMPGETTITRRGERTVCIRTTGHDKMRFTVILSATADGKKLKPFVVFKGVRPVAELMAVPGVVVYFRHNGWMNEVLTKEWIDKVWGRLNFQRRLLVWDAYRCHIMSTVTSHVDRSTNTDISVIPGGLTSHLQPADVSWNKPFKQAYKALYNEWMVSGEKSYTPAGNVRAPDKALCLNWVKEAWKSVTSDVTKKSFLVHVHVCGISASTDGSQDSEIGCIKDGGIAAEAARIIAEKTRDLPVDGENEEQDPFTDDEDELEANETVVHDS